MLIIPVYVICNKILFPSSKYNLAELATAITFMMGQLMLLEVAINLISVVFPGFYHFSRILVMIAELGILFVLGYKLLKDKWYHALEIRTDLSNHFSGHAHGAHGNPGNSGIYV
ncbi:MAG: hypothetical protein IPP06_17375 [Saprospiraceae bacterium]|nr:hypothetical protein [Candidatus Vicinibacter affinis]